EVRVAGSPRTYLAPRGFDRRRHPATDGRVRLLAPLDPLLWDRALVRAAFGFDYAWEVYRPAHLRRFGWYVCPLLRGDALVGRLDGAVARGALRVRAVWAEPGADLDRPALLACLERHAAACGVDRVVLPRGIRVNGHAPKASPPRA
ncbi:MAG: DNA glycosylase AlkZ-like family protein, partial [Syntrophomonadaceae bacterium]